MQFIQRWDQKTSQLFLSHSYNQYQARISRLISRTGDGPLYLLIAVILMWNDGARGHDFFHCIFKAFIIELPIYWLIKNSFKRERPRNLPVFITPSDRYSLPSGHTAAAFLMAEVTSVFYPMMLWCVFIWAGFIGASRLLLGVHYLSDLVAGACLGLLTAWLVLP
ncbi:MAG: phosphatase PAP2 family protein [Tolumonas sp.]|nr:phosphatase PAP2 family protein [Tolumonas sp.]